MQEVVALVIGAVLVAVFAVIVCSHYVGLFFD
jgi:general stress protein CsbA